MLKVEIFTDGACRGNPGMGGWGAFLRYQCHEKSLWGSEDNTTNNRMELMAPIMALKALKKPCHVIITTDSQYVKKGMTEWVLKWKKTNWRTSAKQAVKNKDLWQQLILEAERHKVQWYWIKGHNGHLENEKADQLANQAIEECLKKIS